MIRLSLVRQGCGNVYCWHRSFNYEVGLKWCLPLCAKLEQYIFTFIHQSNQRIGGNDSITQNIYGYPCVVLTAALFLVLSTPTWLFCYPIITGDVHRTAVCLRQLCNKSRGQRDRARTDDCLNHMLVVFDTGQPMGVHTPTRTLTRQNPYPPTKGMDCSHGSKGLNLQWVNPRDE